MTEPKTIKIANYQALELIHESDRTLVYRAQNVENEQSVIIKLMRNQYPSFRELVQFRNQYAISKNLEIEGIIKTYALQRYENRYAMIMEDMGGVSLAEYQPRESLCLSQFLDIVIQLSEIIHQLHNNSIIHKDIKPANILIHPETKQVKLIDFSISTLLAKETQVVQTPNLLEGTLAYLSPEQTGRMNRGIDYRSDFYSLGVTFYELLMGTLPFSSNDTLELIHAHIAISPEPLSELALLGSSLCPPTLSQLVLKLMAKNPEERYQSALGLKYDLEKCLAQYRESGKIEAFELGERDLCDRFIIPEKLYGREIEVQALLDAFERVAEGKSEMVMVAGFSGIGKTAVVNEVHKPIVRQRGYFIKGKFDQFNRNVPFSAFVIAFRSLMGQIISESDAKLLEWKTQILEAVGNNGQVLIDVIPELEKVIGQQPPVLEISGSAAQNRFNLLFEKFIAVFTTKEHPLVMFLDDLQWADSASLNLMKVLIGDNDTGYLLLLGAYRDNEVFPAHPLMLTLAELEKQQAAISTITLAPLTQHHINRLVAETLSCTMELAVPLTKLIYGKTQGNPFFSTQFLKGLYEDELIVFNRNLGSWQCDLIKVQDAYLTGDVVEFMAGRLQKLPVETQEVLKLAACIGNQFDLETLAIVRDSGLEEVASELWSALQEGILLPIGEAYKFFQGDIDSQPSETTNVSYRFLHDRVQQAAYSMIREERKQSTHLRIGRQLLSCTTDGDIEEKIFDIVNQTNLGLELITQLSEKYQLAKLNFIAGKKAKLSTAYAAAHQYADTARCLLSEDCWQQDFEFTLSIFELYSETAYLIGDFPTAEIAINEICERARDVLDRAKGCEIKIQMLISQNQLLEAMRIGLEFLGGLDVKLPIDPNDRDVDRALLEVEQKLDRDCIESLNNLPISTDKKQILVMRILSSLLNAAYLGQPNLLPILIAKQVYLSITYGNTDVSPSAYANYGLILCSIVNDLDLGYRFGNLALNLLEKIDSREFYAKTIEIVCLCVQHWKKHINSTLPLLLEAYNTGLELGDFESAAFAAYDYCAHSFVLGINLIEMERTMFHYSRAIEKLQQTMIFNVNELHRQTVLNLIEGNTTPSLLKGKAYDEDKKVPIHEQENDFSSLALFYIDKLFLCYLFGNSLEATKLAHQVESYLEGIPGQVFVPIFYFYTTLSWLSLYCHLDNEEKEIAFDKILSYQLKMEKWANNAPMNYIHKLELIKAEKSRILNQKEEAIELYDRTISAAKENGYIQEEALANELFAKFYLDWGKERYAAIHMQDAYYCYAQWGAKAKTDDLEQRYPELLKPILQRDRQSVSSQATISEITSNTYSQTATITNISSILNFSSLLKASQTLSGEIELSRLLSTVMKIILENAGATKGALLLTSETGLMVEAIASRTGESSQLTIDSLNQSIPLEESIDLPVGLINYVRRTTETALLDAKAAQEQFAADSYLLHFHPQSLLCMPLLQRGKLIGILYLENRLTADAFTRERLEILDTLCAQAAISLQNARLYQQAQQALKDLQEAQLQLVQNEKMATLGNLVAGVAHEINNPVGFIGGNINIAVEYLQDLLNGLSLYQKYASIPDEIIAEIEDLELDFVASDFRKLIASMEEGCERIRNISTSLRTFSRTDTASKTEFNLHDGIDSTLLILKYRLKANKNRPAIEVVKNYGALPLVKCYTGQLNQVFMNLLANAIDALDESNEGKTYPDMKNNPNCITIRTQLSEDLQNAIVQISDNGTGMPEEVKARLFEQGFTTKGVGKGTGLGMAIAYQIVTEKHGGKITCNSKVGQGTIFTIMIPRSNLAGSA
ncbi:trifunctional serine/threonine-protein kinase/ATP-binding protein/sensor histidine kinase [Dapis sp. BLCC M229]|uniref:trifunctional serine/threonine-protein kinase/ATP-binding protein/sensor histidine kinase n=1 Tax=Dapis sp. BLCC M229 TaxID=3400188 RepID=UPI003CE79F19